MVVKRTWCLCKRNWEDVPGFPNQCNTYTTRSGIIIANTSLRTRCVADNDKYWFCPQQPNVASYARSCRTREILRFEPTPNEAIPAPHGVKYWLGIMDRTCKCCGGRGAANHEQTADISLRHDLAALTRAACSLIVS